MVTFFTLQADLLTLSKTFFEFILLCQILSILHKKFKDKMNTDITLLDCWVNILTFVVSVSQNKLNKILHFITIAVQKKSLSLWEAQSLTGLLFFSFCCCLWIFVVTYCSDWSIHYQQHISSQVLNDIWWWKTLFSVYNRVKFFDFSFWLLIHLFANVCKHELGTFFLENVQDCTCDWWKHTSSIFSDHALMRTTSSHQLDASFNINVFEIIVIQTALLKWALLWCRKVLMIHSDNNQHNWVSSSKLYDLQIKMSLCVEFFFLQLSMT